MVNFAIIEASIYTTTQIILIALSGYFLVSIKVIEYN